MIREFPETYAYNSVKEYTVGAITHYLVVTRWESRQAIEAFAGSDIARAKYYREDVDFLLEFEPTVEHYEVG